MTTPIIFESQEMRLNSFDRPPVYRMNPLILIAEDNEDSRSMLKFLLEQWRYRVVEAADGIEAVRIAENTRPDLILMDVRLPLLDGIEATEQIRASENTRRVPIIFLSACAEKIYRQAAIAAGANEYLPKPFDFDMLEAVLKKHVQGQIVS